MKAFLLLLKLLLAIALISFGCNHLSKPSNSSVAFGLIEIGLAILVLYSPAKLLIKQF